MFLVKSVLPDGRFQWYEVSALTDAEAYELVQEEFPKVEILSVKPLDEMENLESPSVEVPITPAGVSMHLPSTSEAPGGAEVRRVGGG